MIFKKVLLKLIKAKAEDLIRSFTLFMSWAPHSIEKLVLSSVEKSYK